MINFYEVNETQQMIEHENLDVRTITLGISLLDCIDSNLDKLNQKVYEKITTVAKDLVVTGDQIEQGRLAGAVRPDQTDALAALDVTGKPLDRMQSAEIAAGIPDF